MPNDDNPLNLSPPIKATCRWCGGKGMVIIITAAAMIDPTGSLPTGPVANAEGLVDCKECGGKGTAGGS